MARKNKIFDWIMWIIGIIVAIGIGSLFIAGNFMIGPILNLPIFPILIHQIIGWILIGTTIGGAIYHLFIK